MTVYDTDDFLGGRGPVGGSTGTKSRAATRSVSAVSYGVPKGAVFATPAAGPAAITGPSDYLIRVSAQDPSTMFSDAGRTTQAVNDGAVLSWVQVGASATQDVFDNWVGGDTPILRDLGDRKALHFVTTTSRLKQNAYDDTSTLNTTLPTAAEPYFAWSVLRPVGTSSTTAYMVWGNPSTSQRATIGFTPFGGELQSNDLDVGAASISQPDVVFSWYDGVNTYGQVNNGTVLSEVDALNVGTTGQRNRGVQFGFPEFLTREFYLYSAGLYDYVLTAGERGDLYQELVVESNL